MATAFQFTGAQLAEIQRLRDLLDNNPNKQLASGGVPLYSYIFKCVTGIDLVNGDFTAPIDTLLAAGANAATMPQDEHLSMIWLYGALQVNSSTGAFSEVIRQYNIRQGQLRGKTFTEGKLNEASNAVAILFADSILNTHGQRLPTVEEIGNADLLGVRDTLYPGNELPTSELYLNQAWPGINGGVRSKI